MTNDDHIFTAEKVAESPLLQELLKEDEGKPPFVAYSFRALTNELLIDQEVWSRAGEESARETFLKALKREGHSCTKIELLSQRTVD